MVLDYLCWSRMCFAKASERVKDLSHSERRIQEKHVDVSEDSPDLNNRQTHTER